MQNQNKAFVRKASVIVFYDEEGRILLQKRSGDISKSGEEWGYFGGGIEDGETAEQAIMREIKEELGYELKNFKLFGNYDNIYHNQKSKRDVKVCRTIFVSPVDEEIIASKVLEGDGMRLFSTTEAKKLKLLPGDEIVVERFEKYINHYNGQ